MYKKEIYSPKRQLKIIEQNGQTLLVTPDGLAPTPLAKALKAEANDWLAMKLWDIMRENLRADAVKIGIVEYKEEEHARYAKAIYYVLDMMEKTLKEIADLKTE